MHHGRLEVAFAHWSYLSLLATTILQTPRAWRFVDQNDCYGRLTSIYSERSQQCGLHIKAPQVVDVDLKPIAHQVYCMKVPVSSSSIRNNHFPTLSRLEFMKMVGYAFDPSFITNSQFPALRHLRVHTSVRPEKGISSFPSLESLSIGVTVGEAGSSVIYASLIYIQLVRNGSSKFIFLYGISQGRYIYRHNRSLRRVYQSSSHLLPTPTFIVNEATLCSSAWSRYR